MLREEWNFHGDIAVPLENIAKPPFGQIDRPETKIYDADVIETKSFIEVMIILLREKTDMENDCNDVDKFIKDCAVYLETNGNSMPKEIAQNLFDSFRKLYC